LYFSGDGLALERAQKLCSRLLLRTTTRALVEGPTRSPNNVTVQELNNASAILTTAVAYTCQVLHDEYN
jgi:hypothetical protein